MLNADLLIYTVIAKNTGYSTPYIWHIHVLSVKKLMGDHMPSDILTYILQTFNGIRVREVDICISSIKTDLLQGQETFFLGHCLEGLCHHLPL